MPNLCKSGVSPCKVVLFINSCLSLSLSSLPRIDPTHRLTGRSQATTDAQDRVELVSEFAMPFYRTPGRLLRRTR